ncbi:peptide ABC transporter substrate-binding protein [Levilactobacillus brevis]|uniref:Peptide ABC transporter substrate-binding protein n=1 Tax=Levilactobacillus brevis TaxID=1580 RepID=A0AA41ERP0_LEVBR|nr:peptide ABC transporter substrate-binding protein [Levilactobacillus brevis]KID43786.1 Oligopeptide ABC transporter, periplasmic oligopeptide-binding protein OppA [Levilactobacillus brevis]MBS0948484.1 peptide ABC transporter substrate-binding protein [Levilactobacillus brevis]MBS0979034.1 peptide ABC transporter substrate-binding protein [Levilactobacillus brevis]MBS1011629.1 peptide ABC transporter substrate-binding protein [Levilactobacillus brevis]MCU0198602.1 peptide ABC transporter su
MNKVMGLGVGLLAVMALAGCGAQAKSTTDKALNVTMTGNPATANPAISGDTNSSSMISQTSEGLYTLNSHGKVIAGVAEKVVKPTKNGTVYTFKLKKNAKWQNGDAVTAQDFVTSMDWQVNPQSKSQVANKLKYVKNYSAIQAGKKAASTLGVKALNQRTLQITLTQPQPWLPDILATAVYPIKTSLFKQVGGSKYGTSAAKTMSEGAYKLVGWNGAADSWSYVKNPHYWNAKNVKIKRVNVQVVKDAGTSSNLFKSGKVQETVLTGQYIKQNANNPEMTTTLNSSMRFLEFNDKRTITHNTKVRQAFSYVVNRQALTENVLQDGSKAATSLIPSGDGTNPKTGKDFTKEVGNLVSYNPQKATKLWQQAKQELGIKKASLELLTADTDEQKHAAQYLQQQTQKYLPGLTITIKSMPLAQQIAKGAAGNFDIDLDGWTTDWRDPADFLQMADGTSSVNFTKWQNAHFTNLMKKVDDTATYTTAQRWNLMKQADTYVTKQAGLVPLYQQAKAHLVSKTVGGLTYTMTTDAQYKYAYWK